MIKKALLAIATIASLAFNVSAQKSGGDNGLGIRLNVGFPVGLTTIREVLPAYTLSYIPYVTEGTAFGLSLDNRWYIWDSKEMGAAIQARWFDGNFLSGYLRFEDCEYESEDIDMTQFSGGILGVGPMITWHLNNNMAIDAYYNIMPAIYYAKLKSHDFVYADDFVDPVIKQDKTITFWGIGASHHLGAAFRWKLLQAGVEYRFGNINKIKEKDYDYLEMDATLKMVKINLGVKF